ncbi:hypothetical protein TTHT_0822 [Thermotomaculum hydrothermale]|uniref:DUF3187 family protein n=1 Tax=Thermotomaculum hydrothermale TaxID=981385 RepID=A0A7R6SYB7_9BACT|nr:DUF3187 family protein [Thermotomaculum hydrothermale]BBB32386.1 hypothetical protein TTHT_0822 [Thermotomaculum hydrothermale]
MLRRKKRISADRKLSLLSAFLIFTFFLTTNLFSQSLFIKNNAPFYLNILQPDFEQFDFYNGKKYNITFTTQYSNIFAYSFIDNPELDKNIAFDMETLSITTKIERRLTAFSSIYIEIPAIYHWKGMFDSIIEDYHDYVGFNNGGRELVENNQFVFRIGEINKTTSVAGIGDITLGYNIYKVRDISNFRFNFSIFCKLPVASVSDGLSSGSFDFGFGFNGENRFNNFNLFYGLGYLNYGNPDKKYVTSLDESGYIYFGLSYKINEDFKAIGQLYLQSSPYNTGFDRMDDYMAMFALGIQYRDYQVSFTEDVFTYTAPDITVTVTKKIRF